MDKKVKCVITQEIVDTKSFNSPTDCYAMAAMKEAGLSQSQAEEYYEQVSDLPSTCGNNEFGDDLCLLDARLTARFRFTRGNIPTIPLEFEVIIKQ